MVNISLILKNDLLIIAYFLKKHGWKEANKSTFQRILYFSAALSPIFLPHENWEYFFSNTLFGPYNSDLSVEMSDLQTKEFLNLEERKIYSNRIEERYSISNKGIEMCEKQLFLLRPLKERIIWFDNLVKTLSMYGEEFLSKLVKEDPNIYYQNKMNKKVKIITDDSTENLSKEFFEFLKLHGLENKYKYSNNQDILLLFFDILYQKYKGENM